MENLDRHVTIIFFADIVGYTALMQENEQDALSKLEHYERAIQIETKRYDGEIIKAYGDGCLILFSSGLNAVHCAINIQKALRLDPVVPLRIGIHIGEVVRKDHDVFGNSVNVTSRIESMGVANSVLISSDVYNQIKNRPEIETKSLGPFEFKNVNRSIELFAITNNALVVPKPEQMQGKGSKQGPPALLSKGNFRLAIIALVLITGLALLVKFIMPTGSGHTEEFTSNLQALDMFFKGELHQRKDTHAGMDTAISYYTKAIQYDSEYAAAYSNLATVYMRKHLTFDPNTKWEEEAYAAANKALLLDPDLAIPHLIKGQFYWSQSHNFAHEEAYHEFVKAIKKDPELSSAYELLALVQLHIGLFDEAIINAEKSIKLDPGNYKARRFVGEAYLFQGDYSTSMKELEKIPSKFALEHAMSIKALNMFYLRELEKAVDIIQKGFSTYPSSPNLSSVNAILMASQGRSDEAVQMKEIAITNSKEVIHVHHIYYHLGIAAALMGKKEEAVEWLNRAADTGFPNYPLFNTDPNFVSLKGHPDFEELLRKLEEKWEHYQTLNYVGK